MCRAPAAVHAPRRPDTSFFFNDTATTEIYTLSLHDALPISVAQGERLRADGLGEQALDLVDRKRLGQSPAKLERDRKSTRLNSSHSSISYAVFCLKKKKTITSSECTTRRQPHRAPAWTIRTR